MMPLDDGISEGVVDCIRGSSTKNINITTYMLMCVHTTADFYDVVVLRVVDKKKEVGGGEDRRD